MELFVLRHGHAESEAPRDQLRALSAHGQREVEGAIRANKTELAQIQSLVVSPYLRAQQTAKIVAQELNNLPKQDCELLVPGAQPTKLIEYLHSLFNEKGVSSLMLVSHQPLVGVLLDDLCGLEPGKHRMATASLAAIDFDVMARECCRLRWVRHVLG